MKEHDSVLFHDNDFEFFIDPNGDNHEYYEFEINALGTGWDSAPAASIQGRRKGAEQLGDSWSQVRDSPGRDLERSAATRTAAGRSSSRFRGRRWGSWRGAGRRRADGDQWRVNFSRVEWPLSVVDGAYRKPSRGSAEHNWVWSPQHVVDMHRPETWGYVQFSIRQAGDGVVQAGPVAAGETMAARGVLRAARIQRRRTAAGPATLAELGTSSGIAGLSAPAMSTAGSLFEASVDLRLPDGKTQRWHIRQDSLIWPGE